MKGRQLTDVSRRRFDVSQSPVQLQGSPDFGRLRDSSSPLPSPLLLPSFVLQARSPSFQLLRSHPFSSVNEPVERKGERRWVEQRESKNFALCPATFSLSLLLASAQVFSSSFSVFFPPSLFFFFLPLPLPLQQRRFLATIGEVNRNFRFSKSMALLLLPVYSFYCPRQ